MKTILIILVFLISSSLFSDDISDFEIEGMSVGDSLLDYMSESEIKKEIELNKNMYGDLEKGKFREVYRYESLLTYDLISFMVKIDLESKNKKNNDFIIYSIRGFIPYDIRACKKIQNEIVEDFSTILENVEKKSQSWNNIEGFFNKVDFIFPLGDRIKVMCYDYEESITNKYGWRDGLDVTINTNEVFQWMINK